MMTVTDVLHALTALEDQGNGHYTMAGGQVWVYPAAGFTGTGMVDGQPVRCLTAEVQVLCHAGYQLREVDFNDMQALHRRFGVQLLPDHHRPSANSRGVLALYAIPYFERPGKWGRIVALVVDQAQQGRGIGRRLVEQAHQVAAELGCTDMEVTNSRHRMGARAFVMRAQEKVARGRQVTCGWSGSLSRQARSRLDEGGQPPIRLSPSGPPG